jgi:hypothetical protein
MTKDERQDEVFGAVRIAFEKKHSPDNQRLRKDLKQLLAMREEQIKLRYLGRVLTTLNLNDEQVAAIKAIRDGD